MVIGIDGSRAFTRERTGTENYSYHLITHMLALPEAAAHIFVLFTRPNALIPSEIRRYGNVNVVTVPWKYLWTQGGLAGETYNKFQIPNSKFKTGMYQKYGIKNGEYILFVGTVQPRKNVASLVAAFARARLPRHYKLVISGAIGWMAAVDLAAPHEFEI